VKARARVSADIETVQEGRDMPTAARLKLGFEEGPCPCCGARVQLEFGHPLEPRAGSPVERTTCPECGLEIVAETRGSRFWYTVDEFARKESPALRLIRSSRQWFALAVELHLAAVEVLGPDSRALTEQFERADAALRQALAPALDRARDKVAGRQSSAS
jgi:hypothetical protein